MRCMSVVCERDPLASSAAPSRAELLRRARLPLLVAAAAVVAVAIGAGAPVHAVVAIAHRLAGADPAWIAAGAGLEVLSFAGYVLLLWHVAGRDSPRFGLRESYRTTVAGAAATRLLPTAGAGGAALTLWVLRRAGLRGAAGARTLLGFLVVLYAVFLLAVAGAGAGVALGGRAAIGAGPAALAVVCMAVAVALAYRPPRSGGRLGAGAATLGLAVRDAAALVRAGDPRLLGALAWWGFDIAVLWAAFHAVGAPPPVGTLILAYVLGQVANTVPLPGAASSGLAGVLIALGGDPAVTVAAVMAYRVIAIWLPAPAGAHALAGLRRSTARWAHDDAHAPQPLAA